MVPRINFVGNSLDIRNKKDFGFGIMAECIRDLNGKVVYLNRTWRRLIRKREMERNTDIRFL